MQKTVQVVIEIPEKHFKKICANKEDAVIAHDTCRRIANGTILPSPCDVCRFRPPSSADGKPCCMCPAEKGASSDADSD